MSYNDIRAAVINASVDVQKKGLILGTSGNISLRSEDGKVIAITPSSIPYEDLTPKQKSPRKAGGFLFRAKL